MKVAKRIKSRFTDRHIDTQGQGDYKETQKQVLKHFSLVCKFTQIHLGTGAPPNAGEDKNESSIILKYQKQSAVNDLSINLFKVIKNQTFISFISRS